MKVYCCNDLSIENLGSVVVAFGEKLMDKGTIFVTDNWYTSVYLALYLQKRDTGLRGTLRKNKNILQKW